MSRGDNEESQQVNMIFLICALGFEFWMTLHRLVGNMMDRVNIFLLIGNMLGRVNIV